MRRTYSMKPYFNSLKYMIFFYDIIIKKSNYTKEALFEELGISYMSYTRAKDDDTNAGRNIIDKLNYYFKVRNIDYSKQDKYEKTINAILYRFYYRCDDINEFKPVLLEYINEETYLKPIFLLVLLLIDLVTVKSPQVILEEKMDLFNELKPYKKNFFISPFSEIFVIIEIIFNGNKLIEFEKEINFLDNMKGLLYNVYCTNAYLSKKYDLCLYYAKECKDYLIKDHNYKRLISVNLTYFACLNMIGEYNKCMEESKRQLLYLIETKEPYELIYATQMHYYTACIGIKDYNEVIDSILNKANINSSEFIFLLIASYNNKKLYYKYVERFQNKLTKFNDKQNEYVGLVIEYLSKKKKVLSKDKILKSQLNIGIKNILLKFF